MSQFFEYKRKRNTRRGRTEARLAEKAGMIHLPKPVEYDLDLEFDRDGMLMKLGGRNVQVDRASAGGYQRNYEDDRAQAYAKSFNWGLFEIPLLSLRDDGEFWVVSGQHRLAAAGYANIKKVRCQVYQGLTREQESYLFNQESTQRRNLTALADFHSGVMAGFPDHVAVKEIVESLGGKIAVKSSPRASNITGVVAVNGLLNVYDHGGPDLTRHALNVINQGFGSLKGKGIDGVLFTAMAQFLGIYSKGSPKGEVETKKLIKKLQETTPEALSMEAAVYAKKGRVPARFHALYDLYNYRTQEHKKLEWVTPDWRKSMTHYCTVPNCGTMGGKPGRSYRRGLCRKHYDEAKAGENFR